MSSPPCPLPPPILYLTVDFDFQVPNLFYKIVILYIMLSNKVI